MTHGTRTTLAALTLGLGLASAPMPASHAGPNEIFRSASSQSKRFTKAYDRRFSDSDRRRFARLREVMVRDHLRARGIVDGGVLEAMATVPMEMFCPDHATSLLYQDRPIPIGFDESISQPFITAQMLSALGLRKGDKVLEIKTASGYQSVLLAKMGVRTYTLETDAKLARLLDRVFRAFGLSNLTMKVVRDPRKGWASKGPFDGIIATAAFRTVPDALLTQLKPGGRLLAPIGGRQQELVVITKEPDRGYAKQSLGGVRFSMMPGE